MKTHVVYHGNCPDGMTAAWAAWKSLGDDAIYTPAFFGHPVPESIADGDRVYLLDFSYRRPEILVLAARTSLMILDHHKTALDDLGDLPFARINLGHSGAWMAWNHFAAPLDTTPPTLVSYAEDRDLWRYMLPHSREISQWMRCFPFELSAWDLAAAQLERDFKSCVAEGVAMKRFQDQTVRTICDNARVMTIGGFKVHVANTSAFFSEVCEELCLRHPDEPFGAYYFDRADGLRQWGTRSQAGFDVSVIARQLGGGGHASAAGWQEPTP